MEQENVPISENIRMAHYEEQHPKEGLCQKYRLTKNSTVKLFLLRTKKFELPITP